MIGVSCDGCGGGVSDCWHLVVVVVVVVVVVAVVALLVTVPSLFRVHSTATQTV